MSLHHEVVIAQQIAVIAREDEACFFVDATLIEHGENPASGVVDLSHLRVIADPHLMHGFGR
jgi:hypothetical protein